MVGTGRLVACAPKIRANAEVGKRTAVSLKLLRHFRARAPSSPPRRTMTRRATLRAVLALALVAVLVSAQDASCEMQGSCDAGLSSPDAGSTVEPAIEATTVEATPETAEAPEPEAQSRRLDPSLDETPSVEPATPPPLADVLETVEDPVEVEDHAAIASALRLELRDARAEIERLERIKLDERLTERQTTVRETVSNVGSDETDETTNTGVPASSSLVGNDDEKSRVRSVRSSLDSEDPWFPPWVRRRAGQALAELDVARRAVTALCRAILDGFGVLHHVDAFVLEAQRVLQPYVDAAAKMCERVAEKYRVARGNVEKLVREFRKSSARRRERKRAELAAERQRKLDSGEFVEPELPRFSEVYWKRQGQRANALFGDLQMAVGGAYGAARAKVNDASRDARASFEVTKHKFKTRVYPAWARVRLAVSREAVPVAAFLMETFPGKAEKALVAAAKALRRVGFVGYDDLAKVQSAKDFGLVLGDAFLALALSCGLVPALYFVVFRARPGDTRPDEATVEIKHVPANDGTFLGSHVGGGVDVVVTLPEVKRARECDILVGEDEVKVRALEGFHDVTVAIPPEAKGSSWRAGSDAWVMRAKFDLKTEALTVSLRTPGALAARGAASPLGDEKENKSAKNAKGGAGVSANKAAPFSPVTPNRSVAADKAAAAVKAATSTRKKKASGANAEA